MKKRNMPTAYEGGPTAAINYSLRQGVAEEAM